MPLNDADRWDWLETLRTEATKALVSSSKNPQGVVVTCSALKKKYRDVIRVAPYFDSSIKVHFVYLSASEDVLLQRVTAREAEGHYMGGNMVKSQFESLEAPRPEEHDIVTVDVSQEREQVKAQALDLVRTRLSVAQA